MEGIIGILVIGGFIVAVALLGQRTRRLNAESTNANKPPVDEDPCCNAKNGCGRDECDD